MAVKDRTKVPWYVFTIVAALVLTAVVCIVAYRWSARLAAEVQGASIDFENCSALAARISPLLARARETGAGSVPDSGRPLESRVTELAAENGIDSPHLASIEPGTVLTVGPDRQEETTRVRLKDVQLEELVRFLHSLQEGLENVLLKKLSLEASRGSPGRWNVELELSRLKAARGASS